MVRLDSYKAALWIRTAEDGFPTRIQRLFKVASDEAFEYGAYFIRGFLAKEYCKTCGSFSRILEQQPACPTGLYLVSTPS